MRTSSYANDELKEVKKQEDYKSIFVTTFRYLWPDELIFRIRVITSLFCLVLAKVFTVLTPLLLMTLVDELNVLVNGTKTGDVCNMGSTCLGFGLWSSKIFIGCFRTN